MRKIDEAEEQAAKLMVKKRRILAAVALGIICVSFYGWWRKTMPYANAVLVPKDEIAEASRKVKGDVIVYVSGRVEHPGLVKVHAGDRALDAVNAAGGLLSGSDVSKVNLAQELRDGMQIHVPGQALMQNDSNEGKYAGANPAQHQSDISNGISGGPSAAININTADASELDKLPGVGPAMAARIVDWRKANGPFKDGADLKKVKGIGEAKYQRLKDKISW